MDYLKQIEIVEFDFNPENGVVTEVNNNKSCIQLNLKNQNPIVILDIPQEEFSKYIGECDYKFRKGIGIKGEVQRLHFVKKVDDNTSIFNPYNKKNNRLHIDYETEIELETKYIYPFVLSPHLSESGLEWDKNKTYVIFPYDVKAKSKQPISSETLKKEAPKLYNYLYSNKSKLLKQSSYNKRVQNTSEFYGVIRVGNYTYTDCFVAIRDNTKLNPCIIKKLTTDWQEEKLPLFDGHISYISQNPNGEFISCEEAEYIYNKLKEAEYIVLKIFNSRSISSKLPIKLPIFKEMK